MAQYEKLINLGLLSQFLTKAKTIFAPKITASGILKGDGQGGVSAAVAGTDYATPGLGLTGASVGDLVRVNAVDANGKPTSWNRVALNEIKTNTNLLDNWYFVGGGSQLGDGVFPINQRGQTVYSGIGYGIDRWKNTTMPVAISSNNVALTNSNSTNQEFFEIISSNFNVFSGRTLTISILTSSGVLYSSAGTIAVAQPSSTTAYITANIPNVGTVQLSWSKPNQYYFYNIRIQPGKALEIVAVKLELGSEQTLAHNEGTEQNPLWVLNEVPDYSEELFKCVTSTADSADPYANKTYNKVFSAKNRIEASEDFDNYRGINAIGFYTVNGTPTNAPASFGTLLVFQSASSTGCTQMYLAQGKIFLRQYGGNPSSWGSWKSISLS